MNLKHYQVVVDFAKREKHSLKGLFVFSLFSNVLLLSIPFVIKQLIEQYSILVYQQATVFLILLAFLFMGGICMMRIFQMHLSERLQRRLFLDGAERIKKNIIIGQQKNTPLGLDSVNYFFESVNLQKSLAPLFIDGSTLAVQSVIVSILISIYHPLFFLYSIMVGLALYFVLFIMGQKTERLSHLESKKKYAVVDHLQTMAQNTTTTSEDDLQLLDRRLADYFLVREDRYQLYFKQALSVLLIKVVASGVLLAFGGLLVVNNKMTIGQLVASELIITNLLISLFKFTHLLDYWYDTIVGLTKIEKYLPHGGLE